MLIGHLVGLVGIFLLVAVFQANDRRTILRLQILSNIVWAIYYVLLGGFTAAGLILLGVVRSFAFDKYRDHEWVFTVIIMLYIIMTALTWHHWTSAMALIGMTLATTALWQKKPRNIRLWSLSVTPFWLTYNVLNGSYIGAIGDLITFSSVVVGILRFDLSTNLSERYHRAKDFWASRAKTDDTL